MTAPAESVSASIFEASTEIIRKGEAGKPNEFGKVVRTQEGENQIVVDYEVHDQRPSDSDLLIPSIEAHQRALDRAPHLVAADAASTPRQMTLKPRQWVSSGSAYPTVPPTRKREQKKRWFRTGQKWRTESEGPISVSKRRNGLNPCRYKGDRGMKRWVGLGVIADTLINIGQVLAQAVVEP